MDNGTETKLREVIIIGGGLAGLSAAVYLGRSRRDTLLIHSGRSMAKWESDVQNYLGFPEGIDGNELLARGMAQVRRYGVELLDDDIQSLRGETETFLLLVRAAVGWSPRVARDGDHSVRCRTPRSRAPRAREVPPRDRLTALARICCLTFMVERA